MCRLLLKSLQPVCVIVVALVTMSMTAVLSAAEPAYSLRVVADRDTAIYEVGEEAVFLITVSHGEERVTDGSVTFIVDDYLAGGEAAGLPEGKVSLAGEPGRVVMTGRRPEFLRCVATYTPAEGKAVRAIAGAGFSPDKIGLSLPVIDDFDEFWVEQKRQLAEVPLDSKLTVVDGKTDGVESFDVQVQCLGEAPVSGYVSKPKDAQPKSLAAVLWVHGAGVRGSSLGTR